MEWYAHFRTNKKQAYAFNDFWFEILLYLAIVTYRLTHKLYRKESYIRSLPHCMWPVKCINDVPIWNCSIAFYPVFCAAYTLSSSLLFLLLFRTYIYNGFHFNIWFIKGSILYNGTNAMADFSYNSTFVDSRTVPFCSCWGMNGQFNFNTQ